MAAGPMEIIGKAANNMQREVKDYKTEELEILKEIGLLKETPRTEDKNRQASITCLAAWTRR